ncbi:MAG: cytochrome C oxidase subunit IV family protein [Euryarchaeota archaeon]|nr:cytochrome C oxidase subunit IV family protein [Euryarchaeota archaeon]
MAAPTTVAHGTERIAQELKRPYVLVLVLLAIVTVAEVQVPTLGRNLDFTTTLQASLLMTSSVVKASLVALYYMHLRYEPRLLSLLPVGPLVFVLLLVVTVMSH